MSYVRGAWDGIKNTKNDDLTISDEEIVMKTIPFDQIPEGILVATGLAKMANEELQSLLSLRTRIGEEYKAQGQQLKRLLGT